MEYILVTLALLCALIGFAGSVLPALPGPPLSFVGLLLLLPCDGVETTTIIVTGIAMVIITILDYIAPIWFTKKRGGSKYGMWGAAIGMFVGLFLGVWGVIIGPFAGAFIGELMAKKTTDKALETAFFSFVAFMLTTGIKFIYCLVLTAIIAVSSWRIIWN
ncbi:MAG: DUF456 domain-containing protein [Bacteroidaceae bacterium]|jgi:uncharacterized protein YqgC (DUF456 family)|nr:DUF456 domain-containing protein [Bacteroidaceae bacterium]